MKTFSRGKFLLLLLLAAAFPACRKQARSAADTYPEYAKLVRKLEVGRIRVVDGDTFWQDNLCIRVLGLDAPEIRNPEHGILIGQPHGPQAKALARKLIESAGVLEYLPYRNDRYGRLLAHVFIDGELLGVKMIQAGLAYETVSFYGDNGFPLLAREFLKAAEQAGRPPFEEPSLWRREHQRTN